MRTLRSLLTGSSFFLVLFWASSLYAQSREVQLQIESQTAIDFTTDQSSFSLSFTAVTSGSGTNTVDVTYTIMANDVVRVDDVVLARLDDLFPDIHFQGKFGSYSKKGGNASLVASQAGFVTITTSDTSLVDKVVDDGDGKLIDGSFIITYQAKAIQDLAAGEHVRTLTVTFADT